MRAATILASTLAILGATACSSLPKATQPAPSMKTGSTVKSGSTSTAARLGIPPGHLPAPGQCRVWMPGQPPGHQPRPRSCGNIERTAPPGSWIVYRPQIDKKIVHVRVVDDRRAGIVIQRRVYDIQHGTLLRQS